MLSAHRAREGLPACQAFGGPCPLTRLRVSMPCGVASEHPKLWVKLAGRNQHQAFPSQINSRRNLMDFAEGIWREVCCKPGCNPLGSRSLRDMPPVIYL